MINLTYLVHVGCHLDRHVVAEAGTDAMAHTGCRALTLWATTGRRRGWEGRTGADADGANGSVGTDGSGRYGYVGADATAGIGKRART
jgi:hypothetical protein